MKILCVFGSLRDVFLANPVTLRYPSDRIPPTPIVPVSPILRLT